MSDLAAASPRPADGHAQLSAWGALEIELDRLGTELRAIDITAMQSPWVDRIYLRARRAWTERRIAETRAKMRAIFRT